MGVQHLTALLGVVYTTCTNAKGETADTTVWLCPVTDDRVDTCIDPGENAAPPTKAHIHLKETPIAKRQSVPMPSNESSVETKP